MLQKLGLLVLSSRSPVTLTQQLRAPLATVLGMKVRGSRRLGKMAPIQLRRPVIGRERGDKFAPNVYKLSIETRQ